MLVAVIMIFLVMSFTGVAVLDISHNSRAVSQETVTNIKLQYLAESAVNKTLWRINSSADSVVNTIEDGMTTSYDSTTKMLTIVFDTLNTDAEIEIDLEEDTHFERGIASAQAMPADADSAGLDEEAQARGDFNFLPEVDIDYFTNNAVEVHTESWKTWDGDTLANGIHVFTGNWIALEDITLLSGTIVFTGRYVSMWGNNYIKAPDSDSTGANAALIFTHADQSFELYSGSGGEEIYGAIFAKNKITLNKGTISGPIIAKEVVLDNAHDYGFQRFGNEQYYRWTKGFFNRGNYDWPKHLKRWKTKKWMKKKGPWS